MGGLCVLQNLDLRSYTPQLSNHSRYKVCTLRPNNGVLGFMFLYMVIGGDGKRTRFHEKKTRWGFRKLMSLDSFKEAENGYLFGDSCEFGAEVFVVPKYAQKDQCLSMIKPPITMNTHIWTIANFSALKDEALYSEDFKVGQVKWYVRFF